MQNYRYIRRSSFGVPHPSSRRRGVLLLLILALLAMFGLIAVAFVVISGQAQRSAKCIERMGLVTESPEKLLNEAALQVLRGPTSDVSAVRAHSLLEDMYGNEFVYGTIAGTASVAGGQLLDIATTSVVKSGSLTEGTVTGGVATASELTRHIGSVLTITSVGNNTNYRALVGQSARIVAAGTASATTAFVQVAAFPSGLIPPTNSVFTINGSPFSGAGFGYNPATGRFDLVAGTNSGAWSVGTSTAASGTMSVALLPNLPLSLYASTATLGTNASARGNPPGGTNSDYTAADFQHMFLAAQVYNSSAGSVVQTVPSFHRPALMNYWANACGGAMPADVLQKIMLRPLGGSAGSFTTCTGAGGTGTFTLSGGSDSIPHPNFTGSNPNFSPFWDGQTAGAGQWDVDNDGDGVPDSVWVDLGMPVRATADGRLYKPLFAILCTDLDGRFERQRSRLPGANRCAHRGRCRQYDGLYA